MATRINQMMIGIKRGQALNLLCQHNKEFLLEYAGGDEKSIALLDKITWALFKNEEQSNIIEILSGDEELSKLMDINLKY